MRVTYSLIELLKLIEQLDNLKDIKLFKNSIEAIFKYESHLFSAFTIKVIKLRIIEQVYIISKNK